MYLFLACGLAHSVPPSRPFIKRTPGDQTRSTISQVQREGQGCQRGRSKQERANPIFGTKIIQLPSVVTRPPIYQKWPLATLVGVCVAQEAPPPGLEARRGRRIPKCPMLTHSVCLSEPETRRGRDQSLLRLHEIRATPLSLIAAALVLLGQV